MVFGLRNTPKRSRIRGLKRLGRWMNRAPLDIAAASAGSADFTVATVSANYTMLDTDGFVRMTSAAAATITITLHAIPLNQVMYFVNNAGDPAKKMILDPAGAINIHGAATYELTGGFPLATVVWDGTEYWVVSQ